MKRPLCVICCVLIGGIVLFLYLFPPRIPVFDEWDKEEMVITGTIVKKEQRTVNEKETLVIYLKSVQVTEITSQTIPFQGNDSHTKGMEQTNRKEQIRGIICYLNAGEAECRIGERVTVTGRFRAFRRAANPGEFDAALYDAISGYSGSLFQVRVLSESGEYSHFREGLYQVREKLGTGIDRVYAAEDTGLLKAILLGEKSEVDIRQKELYQKSGIIHILAISGLHISVLGMGLYAVLRRLTVPVTPAATVSFLFLVVYGMMVGNSISVWRAIGMFGVQSLGRIWGRTYDLVTSLSLLGLILLLEQPLYVYHSGYWLSFGCVAGIAVLYPALENVLSLDKKYKKMTQPILASVSVTIMTAPLLLWFYYEMPIYSVFLNLLVIPVMTIVLILGVGNLLYISILDIGFKLLGFPVLSSDCYGSGDLVLFLPAKGICKIHHMIFALFDKLCNISQRLPGNTLYSGRPPLACLVLFYVALAGVVFLFLKREQEKEKKTKCRRMKLLVGMLVLSGTFGILLFPKNSGFSVTVLDVGQGNAGVILYQNTAVIIDAGSSDRKDVGENVLLPFLKHHGISTVEAVFVTHPDTDHYNGILSLLESSKEEGICVKMLILPEIANREVRESAAMRKLEETARNQSIPIVYASKGTQLKKGDMMITCMHPDGRDYGEDSNSYSQVLTIKYHLFSITFMGDAQQEAETATLWEMQQTKTGETTVLVAGHHGSKNASGEALLSYLNPKITILSCGKGNSYGHPHEEVLKRLQSVQSQVAISYLTGAVTIRTDGKNVKVEKYLEE